MPVADPAQHVPAAIAANAAGELPLIPHTVAMELLLNLLWMLIAVAVLWTWRTRWIYQRQRIIGVSLREWTAVSVALILLFFAVSMSDDLHMEMALFEDSSASRRGSPHSIDAQDPTAHCGVALHGAGATTVAPVIGTETAPSVFQCLAIVASPRLEFLNGPRSSGRAPPASINRA